jgi:hypothetical protein
MQRRRAVIGFAIAMLAGRAHAVFLLLDAGQRRAYDLYRSAASGSTEALEELRAKANEGDRWAALQFGYLHHTGRAPKVGKDIKVAMKAYRIACKLPGDATAITGNSLAAYNMGLIYLYGEDGVKIDATEAVRWLQAAAGDESHVLVHAAMNLANLYEFGYDNVARDAAESLRWYRVAAARNEAYALYKLGRCLMEGIGTAPNTVDGKLKLNAAAELWSLPAMEYLAMQAMAGKGLQDKNPAEAAKWLLIAAEGDPRYGGAANARLPKLPKDQQEKTRQAARAWIRGHTKVPQQNDYKLPLNLDPYR